MTPSQELINKKPLEFSRKTGCPLGTARNYSSGVGGLQKWIVDIIRFALSRGYNAGIVDEVKEKDKIIKYIPGESKLINNTTSICKK